MNMVGSEIRLKVLLSAPKPDVDVEMWRLKSLWIWCDFQADPSDFRALLNLLRMVQASLLLSEIMGYYNVL